MEATDGCFFGSRKGRERDWGGLVRTMAAQQVLKSGVEGGGRCIILLPGAPLQLFY